MPAEVLAILSRNPMSTAEVARELARRCEVEVSGQWERRVREILDRLQALSLVEPVSE